MNVNDYKTEIENLSPEERGKYEKGKQEIIDMIENFLKSEKPE